MIPGGDDKRPLYLLTDGQIASAWMLAGVLVVLAVLLAAAAVLS